MALSTDRKPEGGARLLSGTHYTAEGERVRAGEVWEPTEQERRLNRDRLATVTARGRGFVSVGIDLKALEKQRKERERT